MSRSRADLDAGPDRPRSVQTMSDADGRQPWMPAMDLRRIGPVDIAVTRARAAIDTIKSAILLGEPAVFGFANAHTVNLARRQPGVREVLARMTLFNDGIGLDLASRLLYGAAFPENLNGTDFTPALLASLPAGMRVYLLGGAPGVAEGARDALGRLFPAINVVGVRDGYFAAGEAAAVAAAVRAAAPQLVLVAMGQPRQEQWAVTHLDQCGGVLLCIGAYLDFVSGRMPRAPALVRRMRAEWAYRLVLEPRRLAGRYLIGNIVFMVAALRQRLQKPI